MRVSEPPAYVYSAVRQCKLRVIMPLTHAIVPLHNGLVLLSPVTISNAPVGFVLANAIEHVLCRFTTAGIACAGDGARL